MRISIFAALLASAFHSATALPSNDHDISTRSAQSIIRELGLIPNVEKGYYIQTYIDDLTMPNSNRSVSTAIYYLLEGSAGFSYWHRVDATEVWHYYAGAPMVLELSWNNGTKTDRRTLGPNVLKGERPQVAIEKHQWQHAKSLGKWTLVGTTMAPAFDVNGFEMHDEEGWKPNDGK